MIIRYKKQLTLLCVVMDNKLSQCLFLIDIKERQCNSTKK